MCKAFLNKNVCLKVAEYYTWAYEGDGAAAIGIAKEIYAHAKFYYESDVIKKFVDPILNATGIGNIDSHANPIDLGGNSKAYTLIFDAIWLV